VNLQTLKRQTAVLEREDPRAARYRAERADFWDRYQHKPLGRYYRRTLARIYRFLIPPGRRVLEIGCAEGDLLAAVEPELGVGVDFSLNMLQCAARGHPELRLIHADAHQIRLDERFDYIILSDLVNDLWDVQQILHQVTRMSSPDTRIIVNTYSRLWELPLAAAKQLGLANPLLGQNWLTLEDLSNMLCLADLEVIRTWQEFLWPIRTPLVDTLCNRYLVKLWPFRYAALTNFLIARPKPQPARRDRPPVVSVVVPARNEAGNVGQIFERVPDMGRGTELVFVEGHSNDGTYEAVQQAMAKYPHRRCKLIRQTGKGKGDAVRLGFARAEGDVLMILDADLTVPPEDLPKFYDVLRSGKGEFVNGVRLVYPMEKQAMRFANTLGNKFFSLAFSWLLGQKIKDTLCGTKVLTRRHYEWIAESRSYFGDFDPFGDFDLIFGAAKLNLKIVDFPIRYRERTYGETNIQRWRHGWLLLQMVLFATRRIKFV
jgi:ubiquinone/menaquinone biosynthesis C-methylase UbiE